MLAIFLRKHNKTCDGELFTLSLRSRSSLLSLLGCSGSPVLLFTER